MSSYFWRLLEIEAMFLDSTDDRGEGYFLMIGHPQTVFDVAIIVRGEGQVLVLDNVFFIDSSKSRFFSRLLEIREGGLYGIG